MKADKIYGENPCQNGQDSENHVDEACTSSENHEVYSDEQSNEDEACDYQIKATCEHHDEQTDIVDGDYQIEDDSNSPSPANPCLTGQVEQNRLDGQNPGLA